MIRRTLEAIEDASLVFARIGRAADPYLGPLLLVLAGAGATALVALALVYLIFWRS